MNNYKIKVFLSVAAVAIFLALFFSDPSVMSKGMSKGLMLCGSTVIPSLFPFVVLSDFIVRSGFCKIVGNGVYGITEKLFRLPGCASCVMIMSVIGGFPIGAKMTAQLKENGELSEKQSRRLMLFCVNGGPAFVISAVGVTMLNNIKAGVIIYASLVITSVITGLVLRFFPDESKDKQKAEKYSDINVNEIINSVSESTTAMLSICAWVVLFSCVTEYVTKFQLSESAVCWINMLCEVTKGCECASQKFSPFMLTFVIAWSGLAVHCQILPYIRKTGLPLVIFWASRLINAGVATLIAWLLFKVFPCDVNVFATFNQFIVRPFSVSVGASVAMLIMGAFAIVENGRLQK